MRGAARVLSNGLPNLRIAPATDAAALVLNASIRLAPNTWLNGQIRLAERPDRGYPDISARAGAVPIPRFVLEPLLVAAHRAAEWRAGASFPTLREAIVAFEAKPHEVIAIVDLPRGLLRRVSRLAPAGDAVEVRRVDALYFAALERFGAQRPVDLIEVYAQMLGTATTYPARDHARAAMVAAAMLAVGPQARRLANPGDSTLAPTFPGTLKLTLGGRADLAMHFALSAAIAAAADGEIGRALGTWKELDDSLAGGSGFSFVDLAADRAGLRLGAATMDEGRASAIMRKFGRRPYPQLLPPQTLGMAEGLGERAFTRTYGNIATDDYAAAIARIDRDLDTLPLMR